MAQPSDDSLSKLLFSLTIILVIVGVVVAVNNKVSDMRVQQEHVTEALRVANSAHKVSVEAFESSQKAVVAASNAGRMAQYAAEEGIKANNRLDAFSKDIVGTCVTVTSDNRAFSMQCQVE